MSELWICSGAKECVHKACHHITPHALSDGDGKLGCGWICANGNHRCIKEKKANWDE